MRKYLLSIVLSLMALVSVSTVAYAYLYRAQVAITENASNNYTMIALLWDSNNDFMATNGFMNSTANDTHIQTLAGTLKPRMIADNKSLTAIPVAANTQTNLYFTTGETEQETSEIIFGYGGYLTTGDDPSLELGDNFTHTCSGCYFDATVSGNITDKPVALNIAGDGSANITASLPGGVPLITANTSGTSASGTTMTVTYPAYNTGDLILLIAAGSGPGAPDFPDFEQTPGDDNFVLLYAENNSLGARYQQGAAWYKVTDGTEGTSGNWTIANVPVAWQAFTIDKYTYSSVPVAGTAATGTASVPNPPTNTPAFNGVTGTLWVAATASNITQSSAPATYSNFNSSGITNAFVATATLQKAAATEDPGTFGTSADEWTANTIAIWGKVIVSASGIASGEIDANVYKNPSFLGIGVDNGTLLPSITDNIVSNYPLWSAYLQNSPIITVDNYQLSATITGAVWGQQGRTFDGADDVIQVTHQSPLDNMPGITIIAWINPDTIGETAGRIVAKATGTGASNGWYFTLFPGGTGTFSFAVDYDGASNLNVIGPNSMVTYGSEQMVAVSWNGSANSTSVHIYKGISGVVTELAHTGGDISGLGNRVADTTTDLTIGNNINTDRAFDGKIGEVIVYNVARSQTEIEQIFSDTDYKYVGASAPDTFEYVSANQTVPDNSNDWTHWTNNVIVYGDNITTSINGTTRLLYAPNDIIAVTTLPDRSGYGNDGTITWGSNPVGITILMGSLQSSGQPTVGSSDVVTTSDLLPVVGGDYSVQPAVSGALLTHPARPVVVAISDNTTLTEIQVWRWLGIAFVMIVTGVTAVNVRSHQGITGVALGAALALVTAQTIFPGWVYAPAALAVIMGLISERSQSL